jgi:hypothetical protein
MRVLLAAILALSASSAALADPTGDVQKALVAFGNASSYHIAVESPKAPKVEGDVSKPDRMHFTMGSSEMITIGGLTYVKAGGNWMRLPQAMPGMAGAALTYVQNLASRPLDAPVEDLGTKSVDGKSYHAYKVSPTGGRPTTIYVDGAGTVARIDVVEGDATSIVRLSNYNVPVKIEAPV